VYQGYGGGTCSESKDDSYNMSLVSGLCYSDAMPCLGPNNTCHDFLMAVDGSLSTYFWFPRTEQAEAFSFHFYPNGDPAEGFDGAVFSFNTVYLHMTSDCAVYGFHLLTIAAVTGWDMPISNQTFTVLCTTARQNFYLGHQVAIGVKLSWQHGPAMPKIAEMGLSTLACETGTYPCAGCTAGCAGGIANQTLCSPHSLCVGMYNYSGTGNQVRVVLMSWVLLLPLLIAACVAT
jgi:hypothetical protein